MSCNRCIWCGREFESFNPKSFCGIKCEREYRAVQAEDRKIAQQKEAARKADPTRWYGYEWASHLTSHPEDALRCNWAVLESADIRTVLEAQPQLVTKCNCTKLSAGSWARLLQVRPEFGDICDKWDGIDAAHWIDLLKKQPSFVAKCRWRLLSKTDVALILKKVPNLELESSELGVLEHQDWADVLSIHPFYAKYCDLASLTGYDWVAILLKQPKLSGKCAWEKLDAYNWLCLLKKRPEFADLCDKWAEYSVKSWIELLIAQPQFFMRCPLDKFNVQEVTMLFSEMPTGSVPKENVASLNGAQLASVLGSRPDYAQNVSLVSLTGENWVALLKKQPSLSRHADWNRLSCKDWIDLLLTRPEFKGHCNWNAFDGDLLCEVLLNHPALVNVDKCTFENFRHQHWERILKKYPELKNRCNNSQIELEKSVEVLVSLMKKEKLTQEDVDKVVGTNGEIFALLNLDSLFNVAQKILNNIDRFPVQKEKKSVKALFEKINANRFSQTQWGVLIAIKPWLVEVADVKNFSARAWGIALSNGCHRGAKGDSAHYPDLMKYCRVDQFSDADWVEFIMGFEGSPFKPWNSDRDMLLNKAKIKCAANLSAKQLLTLISRQKVYATKLGEKKILGTVQGWSNLSLSDWIKMLEAIPESDAFFNLEKYDWKALSGNQLIDLLWDHPHYKKILDSPDFDWSVFTANEWPNLLFKFPEYKGKCDVEKIDWTVLTDSLKWGRALMCCPEQIIGHFNDWESIASNWWPDLVKHQPKLKPYRKKYDKHLGFWGRLFG